MSLFEERCRKLDELLGIDSSYDISKREIEIDNKKAYIYFMPFLVNSGEIIELFFGFYMTDGLDYSLSNKIAHQSISKMQDLESVTTSIFEGMVAIVIEDIADIFVMDMRNYPNRGVSEPETEKVVRGSRDGFTENMATNVALVRRRIKTGKLGVKLYKIGELSKTNVTLIYLED